MESMADGLSETVGLEQKKIDVHECEIMDDGLFEGVELQQYVPECECEIEEIQAKKKNAGFRLKKKLIFLIRYFIRYILPVVIFIVPFFMSKVAYAMNPPPPPPPGLNQPIVAQQVVLQIDREEHARRYYYYLNDIIQLERMINTTRATCDYYGNISHRTEYEEERLAAARRASQQCSLLQRTAYARTIDAATNARIRPDPLLREVRRRIVVVNAAMEFLANNPPTPPASPPHN